MSRYPRNADGTLTELSQLHLPEIGIKKPQAVHVAYRADYGDRFGQGIVDLQPPVLGQAFRSRVPQNDPLGNEVGGIRNVWVAAPVATYLAWNRRSDGALTDFRGTFIPLSKAASSADSRPHIKALYQDRATFVSLSRRVADELAESGYLLAEDVDRAVEFNRSLWDWLHAD